VSPDCRHCGQAAHLTEKRDPTWWACRNEECVTMAFIDDDAPLTEDPRNPQAGLNGFEGEST
jgi:hypothetical protein